MREVWFLAAIVSSTAALFTEDERIRVVALAVASMFWLALLATEAYGRLIKSKHQSDKDA